MGFFRKLKWVFYPLFFVFMFFFSLYLTFPADAIRGYIVEQLENALISQGNGDWVMPPKASIGKMSLWRFSGLKMKDVVLHSGSQSMEPGSEWAFKTLKIRMGLFSTLRGFPKIEFDSDLYDGRARGAVTMTKKGSVASLWFDVSDINLGKLTATSDGSGFPVGGLMNVDAEFDLGKDPALDGQGILTFAFDKLSVGPGLMPLPMPGMEGGLTMPVVNFGKFAGEMSLKKGKGKTQNIKLSGGDMEASLNVEVDLNKNIMRSAIDASGWFSVRPQFLEANPKFKSILEISPELRNAKGSDGKYLFGVKGTFERPYPRWGKSSQPARGEGAQG